MKKDFFGKTKFAIAIQNDQIKYDSAFGYYYNVSKKIHDVFNSKLIVSYYQLDMSTEKFALFFERSNIVFILLFSINVIHIS